ncbi:MAG: GIY-YIG nuclease family protein [Crocinitomicaceae bacterium]
MYFVYVLYSEKANCKYTGYTEDLTRRLNEHNQEILGKFTKGKGPWILIYHEEFATRKEALLREKELKTGKGRDFIKRKTGK